jgi:hypothetical protein
VRPDRRTGYLDDVDWDRNWEPIVSSDDEDDDEDEDEDDAKTALPPRVSGEVSGQIYNGRVIRDDTGAMINHVVYHYFQAANRGEVYQMSPELTKEEELVVAFLISQEEEMRTFPELADTLVLSVAPPPPPGPPPTQPPRTPPARPRREARAEPWDA